MGKGVLAMVTGMARVLRNTEGEIREVFLAVSGGSIYNVVLDEKGKRLGREMEGGKVEATGTVHHKDGTRWMELETYSIIEEWREEDIDNDLDEYLYDDFGDEWKKEVTHEA